MSRKISEAYAMAKNDREFSRRYNENSSGEVEFPKFASFFYMHEVFRVYYGYLLGAERYEEITYINAIKE